MTSITYFINTMERNSYQLKTKQNFLNSLWSRQNNMLIQPITIPNSDTRVGREWNLTLLGVPQFPSWSTSIDLLPP